MERIVVRSLCTSLNRNPLVDMPRKTETVSVSEKAKWV
jgi:hypothetical protein